MIVTINTDASFHSGFKVGAFAFWIKSNEGKITHSGSFKNGVKNSTEAELKCIINAIHTVSKTGWDVTLIIINTDSRNAMAIINNNKEEIKRWNLRWGQSYRDKYSVILKKYPLELRHVKAHKETTTAKSWVNNWCDENAKKQLWKFINKS